LKDGKKFYTADDVKKIKEINFLDQNSMMTEDITINNQE
jgi:hypothetical protein